MNFDRKQLVLEKIEKIITLGDWEGFLDDEIITEATIDLEGIGKPKGRF
jgi:hypothetical protein